MNMSKIQFNTPLLKEIQFIINDKYENKSTNLNVTIKHTNDFGKNDDKNKANVYVEVEIGSKDEFSPFYLKVAYITTFIWEGKIDNIEQLLRINGTSLLYGYIRQTVKSITGDSKIKRIDLPFIDFVDENGSKN